MLSKKKIKRYDTGKVFPYAIYNFGNFGININQSHLSKTVFLTMLRVYDRATHADDVASS